MEGLEPCAVPRHGMAYRDPQLLARGTHRRDQCRGRVFLGSWIVGYPVGPQANAVGAGVGEGVDRHRCPDEGQGRDARLGGFDLAQIVERAHADDHPVDHAMLADHTDNICELHVAAGLDVDHQLRAARADQAQRIGKAWHMLAGEGRRGLAAGVERPDLVERHAGDRAAAVGRAIDRRIMHHHRLAIGGCAGYPARSHRRRCRLHGETPPWCSRAYPASSRDARQPAAGWSTA